MRDLSDIHTIVAQVTDKCPFDCKQCYTKRGHTFLLPLEAERIIDSVFRNRNGLLQITGGEPLIYPYLDELLLFCQKHNIITAIATSVYDCSMSRVKSLQKAGLNYFFVSLNGSTKEIHEKTRCGFNDALAAIKNAKMNGLSCFVNWVACESNADDFPNMISLCKEFGADALYVLKKQADFSGNNEDYPSREQINQIRLQIDRCTDFTIVVEKCYYELFQSNNMCAAGETSFYLDCNGKFSPCAKLFQLKYNSFDEMQADRDRWNELKKQRCNKLGETTCI